MEDNINNFLSELLLIQKLELIANKQNIHPDWVVLDRNKIEEIGEDK